MKTILKIFDDKLGYFFVIPALIFIILFSILPILGSVKYAFFDFQLNNQQKSGMYFSEHYNLDLVDETLDYIEYYLDNELAVVRTDEAKNAINEALTFIGNKYDEFNKEYENKSGVIKISKDQMIEKDKFSNDIINSINNVYKINDEFELEEDIKAVASELQTAIIEPNFSGLDNFTKVIKDKRVQSTILITLFFTVMSVTLELIFGLALALIMNRAFLGRGMIRTLSLIPWAIPTSVAALMWLYLYNGSSGIVANLMASIGVIDQPTDLLLSGVNALWSVIFADVWKTTPYIALLLLAGLQTIPKSLYEAADTDGANKFKQFIHVTLPLLKPSILVALLFRTLDAFRVFDLIWVLTGGGPGGKTESISIYAYKTMFAQTQFGYGSAMVILMALVVGIISYVYIKLLDVKLTS